MVWSELPGQSIHFKCASADYTHMNAYEEFVVEELTQTILRGEVKIVGPYSCVNRLGLPHAEDCKEIEATVPVHILNSFETTFTMQCIPTVASTGGLASGICTWRMLKSQPPAERIERS